MIKLTGVGNLVRDPETRTVQKGDSDGKVTNFTVACSFGYGESRHTIFVRVAAWNGLGKTCAQYLRKGSKVWVSGTPTVNVYLNNDGEAAGNMELRLDEVEFLSSKPTESPINNEETDEDVDELL